MYSGYECSSCYYDYCLCTNGDSNAYETVEFGCTYAGCGVSKTFYVYGTCSNPRLSMQIYETDFAESYETASVYIGGSFVDYCSQLNEDCGYDWYVIVYIYVCNIISK